MTIRLPKKRKKSGTPDYKGIIYEEVHTLPPEASMMPIMVLSSLPDLTPGFWSRFFHRPECQSFLAEHLDKAEGLPLKIVWDINRQDLIHINAWTDATVRRKTRWMDRMLTELKWGRIPIGTLSPEMCGPVFMDEKFSAIEHEGAVTLLRQLADQEVKSKRLTVSPWSRVPRLSRPKKQKKTSSYIDQHIRHNVLPNGQVLYVLNFGLKCLTSSDWRNALALLLVLTMGIPLDELCMLRTADVFLSSAGLPLTLHVRGRVVKKQKHFSEILYGDASPHDRILPIPSAVADALAPLIASWRAKIPEQFDTRYLLPHEKNVFRRTSPKEIEKWINQALKDKLPVSIPMDGKGKPLKKISRSAPYKKCLNSSRLALPYVGFEDDECNYFFGLSAKSVAGGSYCDFANHGELQRMRSLLDLWLGYQGSEAIQDSLAWINPSENSKCCMGKKGHLALLQMTIYVPKVAPEHIPSTGYRLRLSAKYGLSICAATQEGESPYGIQTPR